MPLFRQITIEPVPTGARFMDKDEVLGFGVQLAHELINVTLPRADEVLSISVHMGSGGDLLVVSRALCDAIHGRCTGIHRRQ